jgi:pyruvate ferredoxin oxidoreductase delta subunit
LKALQDIFKGDFMKLTKGAVVEGGTSLNYKTGNWRDQRPEIDQELCNQCGKCREVCPDDAVHHNEDRYEIDYDFCKGCGICAYECKAEAIEILPEEK